MGSVIASYKKPRSAYELAHAVYLFLEYGLHLEVDRDEEYFRIDGDGGRFEVELTGSGCTIVVESDMRRGTAWEEIDGPRRRLIHGWERAGCPEVDFSELVYPLGEGEGPASFCAVEKYKRPTNPDELKQLIRTFLEAEFKMPVGGYADSSGLEIDLNSEGGSNIVRLEAERPEKFEDEPEKPEPEDEAARKIPYYRRPRDQDEFADVLQAMVKNELGMEVVVCMDEDGPERYSDKDQPKPWIYMSLDGLDRDSRTGVHLAILKGNGLLTVVNGEGEIELLKQYRARLKSLGLDDRSAHMVSDFMPEGYTFDMLTADEVRALEAHRASKRLPPVNRLSTADVGEKFEPAVN